MPSISINTNLSSLIAQQSLKQSSNKLNLAVERMSTGFKINHAKDNAANYSISTNMTTKIGAYQVAEDNVAMGLDLLSTANGSLDQISDKLSRLRALAEQSANGTYGAQSRSAINAEANALVDEIERLYNTTTYNGINLSKGKIETSNFIKDIERRDTSKMDKFEEVKIDEALTTGTYSISTAEGLAKLATMTNNGLIGTDTEFVLANDIDLKEWCEANSATGGWVPIGKESAKFNATLDGNGYEVQNMIINRENSEQGFVGCSYAGIIKNLGLTNASVKTTKINSGVLLARCTSCSIENSYATGMLESSSHNVGGLIGFVDGVSKINYCYSDVHIINNNITAGRIGGLAGAAYSANFENSYSSGKIETISENELGALIGMTSYTLEINNCYSNTEMKTPNLPRQAFVGYIYEGSLVNIKNSYYSGDMKNFSAAIIGYIYKTDCLNIENCGFYDISNSKTVNDIYTGNLPTVVNAEPLNIYTEATLPFTISTNAMVSSYDENAEIGLQVGAKGDWASALSVELGYRVDGISALRNIGAGNDDYLSKVDTLINSISAKAVEFGAAQNRLESALDEISTQYENLVSSRSTLRDADISEVSSEYIRQQILQEASATLMATANQNPMIALQLL